MTKSFSLILVTLLLAACGGSPFEGTSEPLAGAGGDGSEAGTAAAPGGGGEALVGGSGNATGGSSATAAGSGHGGRPSGGADAGTAGGGGTPAACEFDVMQLTASLPSTVTWEDFTYTDGSLCVTCRDKPCGNIKVISWGVPQVLGDGRINYLPNSEMPIVSLNIGTNDGACTKSTECGVNINIAALVMTVARDQNGWIVTKAVAQAGSAGNQCASNAGFSNTHPVQTDLETQISQSLTGFKIPCK